MRSRSLIRSAVVLGAAAVLTLAGPTARAQEVRYDGQVSLAPNGDLDMVLKFTLPMAQYQGMRESVSNLYLFMRDLASSRADAEVTQKKADWDDPNRTVTFTIHMLGAARNMGNRWEFEIGPSATFSNFDEDKGVMYFNEVGQGSMAALRGNSRLQLPARASQGKYDAARKVVTYVLPIPASGSLGRTLLIPAAVALVLGLGLFGASFVVGRKPTHLPPTNS
jgi:hypothetical protein